MPVNLHIAALLRLASEAQSRSIGGARLCLKDQPQRAGISSTLEDFPSA